MDIKKFYGVGKVTAEKMYQLGIFTGADLKAKSKDFLEGHFGKSGAYYYQAVRGIHESAVKPNRRQKSVGAERTFEENISSEIFMIERLEHIATELANRLSKSKLSGKTVTLKIKYSDFTLQTRSKTIPYFVADQQSILETAKALLFQDKINNSVRLLGISMSNLSNEQKTPLDKKIQVQLKFDF